MNERRRKSDRECKIEAVKSATRGDKTPTQAAVGKQAEILSEGQMIRQMTYV